MIRLATSIVEAGNRRHWCSGTYFKTAAWRSGQRVWLVIGQSWVRGPSQVLVVSLSKKPFPHCLLLVIPVRIKFENAGRNMQKSSLQRLMLHAVERFTNFHRTFNTFGYYYSVVNLAYIGYNWCSQCFLCSEQLVCNLSTTTARTLAHYAWK